MAENNIKSENKTSSEEIQQQKCCFVIMPFSDPEGYSVGHFRKVYEQIIEPAITDAGFVPVRVDENKISDQIITKIFDGIINCEMAICDLSSNNPNVLYELGLRHAYDKPVVLIQDDITNRIFDIQGISIIPYKSTRRYEEVIEARDSISKAIKINEHSNSRYSVVNATKTSKASYNKETVSSYVRKNFSISGIASSDSKDELITQFINEFIKRLDLYDQKNNYEKNNSVDSKINEIALKIHEIEFYLKNQFKIGDTKFLFEAKSELNYLLKCNQGYLNSEELSQIQITHMKYQIEQIEELQNDINLLICKNVKNSNHS